ncbi:methyltransferase [Elioraea sp.]|jgi:predicted nicotinamide N-methyase|uniref:class I SAM-dependent methyltransferase n=1 Tax=Elioraea sp. TaxID=2185103 RepID=UPI0021DCE9DF|nr:50S ribosomal protein L11 methyltransferase [Elioraea sp.]GIX10066.1 MAG: nicotinamide N-methylase [Elioraea sp.]
MTPEAAAAFVVRQTAIGRAPLVPELALHLAAEITPIWQATEASLAREGVDPPYWAFAWPGGQALARFVLDDPAQVAGRRVLDLAAGGGIAAIAAARAGAAVTAAEIDPLAAAAIRANAALNGVEVAVALGDPLDAPAEAEVILAGDVCYEARMTARVVPWLRAAAGRGIAVLLADPGRAYLPRAGLAPVARYEVAVTRELEDRTVRVTTVYRVLP